VDSRRISLFLEKTVKTEYLQTLHSNVVLRQWNYLLLKVVEKSIQNFSKANITMLSMDRQMDEWMISWVLSISKCRNSASFSV